MKKRSANSKWTVKKAIALFMAIFLAFGFFPTNLISAKTEITFPARICDIFQDENIAENIVSGLGKENINSSDSTYVYIILSFISLLNIVLIYCIAKYRKCLGK